MTVAELYAKVSAQTCAAIKDATRDHMASYDYFEQKMKAAPAARDYFTEALREIDDYLGITPNLGEDHR